MGAEPSQFPTSSLNRDPLQAFGPSHGAKAIGFLADQAELLCPMIDATQLSRQGCFVGFGGERFKLPPPDEPLGRNAQRKLSVWVRYPSRNWKDGRHASRYREGDE